MTDAQESWDKLNLLAATNILKYEKDESEVVNIGYQHCDNLNGAIFGVIKILKESPSKKDISHVIKSFEKLISNIEDQRKWTAKQWIDWAKKIKTKK